MRGPQPGSPVGVLDSPAASAQHEPLRGSSQTLGSPVEHLGCGGTVSEGVNLIKGSYTLFESCDTLTRTVRARN